MAAEQATPERRGTGFARPQALSPWWKAPQATQGDHFNHPRRRKYHIGTSALATISSSAYG